MCVVCCAGWFVFLVARLARLRLCPTKLRAQISNRSVSSSSTTSSSATVDAHLDDILSDVSTFASPEAARRQSTSSTSLAQVLSPKEMTISELRRQLMQRGVNSTGEKAILVKRLETTLKSERSAGDNGGGGGGDDGSVFAKPVPKRGVDRLAVDIDIDADAVGDNNDDNDDNKHDDSGSWQQRRSPDASPTARRRAPANSVKRQARLDADNAATRVVAPSPAPKGDATTRAVADVFCAVQTTSAHAKYVATLESLLQADRRAFIRAFLAALNT